MLLDVRRFVLLMAIGIGAWLGACSGGDDSPGPSPTPVTQVTVTVQKGATPIAGASVVESADIQVVDKTTTVVGKIEEKATDASGKATFTVPASTSTGHLCFVVTYAETSPSTFRGGTKAWCTSLDALDATLVFDMTAPPPPV